MNKVMRSCAAILAVFALAGCATTGSVDALDPRLKEIAVKIDKIEKDLEAAEEMVKSVNDISKKAVKAAEDAIKTGQKVTEKLNP